MGNTVSTAFENGNGVGTLNHVNSTNVIDYGLLFG